MNHATITLLRNARIVLPERVVENASLLIRNGRIAKISNSPISILPAADSEIDLASLTLFPGFIDVHIHGAVGVDSMAASAEDLRRVSEFLASRGVTAWLPTLVPASAAQYKEAIEAIAESLRDQKEIPDGGPRARVVGVHYEGPFVNSERCGALHREHFRPYHGPADLDALPIIKDENAVHMMTLAPEVDGGIDLIRELTRRGWITSIGHTGASVDLLDRAFESGARHLTHFMNAMTPLHHRAPGPVGWGLINDQVTCDLIADSIHLDPAVLKLILRTKGAERISLISDAIAAAGLSDGDYEIWGEKISVKGGRTQNARGNIAGSVITMLDAVRTMLSLGTSEPDVARMASLNPARLLRIDHDCGSVAEEKRADLVALDKTLNTRLIIIGGEIKRNT